MADDETTGGGPAFEEPDFSRLGDDDDAAETAVEAEEEETGRPAPAAGPEEGNSLAGGAAAAVLQHVAVSIVDDKESVVVETRPDRGQLRLSLHVAPGDMGRIIGRRGRTAQAVRTLVRAAAAAEGQDAFVDIVD